MTSYPKWFGAMQPIWDDATPEDDGFFSVAAQRVACFKIDVPQDGYVMVAVVQSMPTQDWSLRCWFSNEQYGTSITFQNDAVSGWNATRSKLSQICLHSGDEVGKDPDGAVVYPFKVAPGSYYLNVQNLYNGQNGGYLLLTNGAV